jgi:HEAT repeat protein
MSSDVPQLPPPSDVSLHPKLLAAELEAHVGNRQAALWCAELLEGADPHEYEGMLWYLGAQATPGVLSGSWELYWVRTWGARGLRYVWVDDCASAIVAGLSDEHWRPAEMCLKVAVLRDIGEAGPGAVSWIDHELPRVRAAACRTLGAIGDTEHLAAVEGRLDDPHPEVRRAAARALAAMARRLDVGLDPADYD